MHLPSPGDAKHFSIVNIQVFLQLKTK